jgi:hypothetical protein
MGSGGPSPSTPPPKKDDPYPDKNIVINPDSPYISIYESDDPKYKNTKIRKQFMNFYGCRQGTGPLVMKKNAPSGTKSVPDNCKSFFSKEEQQRIPDSTFNLYTPEYSENLPSVFCCCTSQTECEKILRKSKTLGGCGFGAISVSQITPGNRTKGGGTCPDNYEPAMMDYGNGPVPVINENTGSICCKYSPGAKNNSKHICINQK